MINPYQIAAVNGRYYLICNYDKYDNAANYRLDRITDIRLLDTPAKPMAEHIYMFSGESAPVTFRLKKYLVSEVIDWFGRDIQFLEESGDEVTARVTVNLETMRRWALQYALHARVVSPRSLADAVKEDIRKAAENYGE